MKTAARERIGVRVPGPPWLNQQYRIVYRVVANEVLVQVIDVTTHDYRRK